MTERLPEDGTAPTTAKDMSSFSDLPSMRAALEAEMLAWPPPGVPSHPGPVLAVGGKD